MPHRLVNLDIELLRAFIAVVDTGSFTRAGDDIGLSQSAVSRQISALERELKAPLFHRHARGLILTEQGDLLFRAARDMKLRLENTRARLVETSERPSGDLRVTTTVGLGTSWLSQRISEFLDLYPYLLRTQAETCQYGSGDAFALSHETEKYMFGAYVVMIESLGLLFGQ